MSSRSASFLMLAGLIAVASSCVHRPSLDELPVSELAGHYTSGESGSWFLACGAAARDSTWATFTNLAVAQRDSIARTGLLTSGTRLFVRWRAAVTEGGEVGPRGPGVPALLVREILVMRSPGDADCAT